MAAKAVIGLKGLTRKQKINHNSILIVDARALV